VSYNQYQREFGTFSEYTAWDAFEIYGCQCGQHPDGYDYVGYNCQQLSCPLGDDPLTDGQINTFMVMYCKATAGSFGIRFPSTNGIDGSPVHGVNLKWDAGVAELKDALMELGSQVEITPTANRDTLCNHAGDNIVTIEFLQDFGRIEPLLANFEHLYHKSESGAEVKIAYDGEPVGEASSYMGTKENIQCSGRGLCDQNLGECFCYLVPMPGYRSSDGYGNPGVRGDCGAPDDHKFWANPNGIAFCPGELPCSGHGVCSGAPQYKCTCSSGWGTGDCSERDCPKGWPWFPAGYFNVIEIGSLMVRQQPEHQACSNRGTCDRTRGECNCQPGFFGAGCQKMSLCPQFAEEPCNGHGSCVSSFQLARDGGFTHEMMNFHEPFVQSRYGTNLHMCKCDMGFEGYDCKSRPCPRADYPITPGVQEKQILLCYANNGTFQLTFGVETTANIQYDATHQEIKKKLEQLQAVGVVNVSFTGSRNMACNDPMPGKEGGPSENNDLNYNVTALRVAQGQNLSNITNFTDWEYPQPNYIVVEFVTDHFYNYTPFIGNLATVVMDPSLPILEVQTEHLHNISFWDAGARRDTIMYGNASFFVRSKGESFKLCPNMHIATKGFMAWEEDDCFDNVTYPELVSVTGTRQWLECGGRGTCNYEIGECSCFKGYSGSDGFGNKGRRRDCGYIGRFDIAI